MLNLDHIDIYYISILGGWMGGGMGGWMDLMGGWINISIDCDQRYYDIKYTTL